MITLLQLLAQGITQEVSHHQNQFSNASLTDPDCALILFSEADLFPKDLQQFIKKATGGDTIRVEHKGLDTINTEYVSASTVITSNKSPQSLAKKRLLEPGISSRLVGIFYKDSYRISYSKMVPHFVSNIAQSHLSEIILWALSAPDVFLRRYRRGRMLRKDLFDAFGAPDDESDLVRAFIANRVVFNTSEFTAYKSLAETFKQYCLDC